MKQSANQWIAQNSCIKQYYIDIYCKLLSSLDYVKLCFGLSMFSINVFPKFKIVIDININ